nr:hypothetical protein [Pantoea agglomerans]
MSNEFELSDSAFISRESGKNYSVVLPCEPQVFGDFISSILGKPQTINKAVFGYFTIDSNDITNIHNLIQQRIHQQNEATLIQFTANIFFSDKSSVLINSIDAYENYNEIKKVSCISIELSWVYLIQFKGKESPEKQEINISIGGGNYLRSPFSSSFYSRHLNAIDDVITINIRHTERTWGVDMESLLTNHFENYLQVYKPYRRFIYKNHESIGVFTGSLLFATLLAGSYLTSVKFMKAYADKVQALSISATGSELMGKKIDFLIELVSTGSWPRFILTLIMFLLFSLVGSFIFGGWVSNRGESRMRSWILLTSTSREHYKNYSSNLDKNIFIFFGSVLISVLCGIIGNVLFSKYFTVLL